MLSRSGISLVLDECCVPSDDRITYYRFILRITEADAKEELEREIEGFATKGCDGDVLLLHKETRFYHPF